jgi:hypothetical protein
MKSVPSQYHILDEFALKYMLKQPAEKQHEKFYSSINKFQAFFNFVIQYFSICCDGKMNI